MRTCRKKTGPRESSLIHTAVIAKCEDDEPRNRADEVERTLEEPGGS